MSEKNSARGKHSSASSAGFMSPPPSSSKARSTSSPRTPSSASSSPSKGLKTSDLTQLSRLTDTISTPFLSQLVKLGTPFTAIPLLQAVKDHIQSVIEDEHLRQVVYENFLIKHTPQHVREQISNSTSAEEIETALFGLQGASGHATLVNHIITQYTLLNTNAQGNSLLAHLREIQLFLENYESIVQCVPELSATFGTVALYGLIQSQCKSLDTMGAFQSIRRNASLSPAKVAKTLRDRLQGVIVTQSIAIPPSNTSLLAAPVHSRPTLEQSAQTIASLEEHNPISSELQALTTDIKRELQSLRSEFVNTIRAAYSQERDDFHSVRERDDYRQRDASPTRYSPTHDYRSRGFQPRGGYRGNAS